MEESSSMPVIIAILALVIVLFSLVGFIAKRLRRVPPNEALIIVGRGAGRTASADSTQRVVIGGRVFVWPILQQGFAMSLEQRQIGITVEGVDKNRIKIAIKASINFKVRGDEEGVRRAAQRFLSQQELLTEIIKESLEGSLRSIVGDMNIEQIISDRKGLSDRVVDSTKLDLAEQGLQVDLLNISDISTPGSDYLANLGRAESARARQVAEVSEAEAKRASEFAVIEAAEQIAERQKALDLRKASIKAETDRANAQAEASGQLARAEQDRLVATQQREALAEQAKVTEEELDISVRKPAEAEAYAKVQEANASRDAANANTEAEAFKRTTIAEANKTAAIQDAEAAAESLRRQGEAERDRQVALAAGIKAEGEARAFAIEAEGRAEAIATDAKAEALQKYGEAALVQELIERLPEIVRAAAEPVGNIQGMTVISTDGATAVTKNVTSVLAEGQQVIKQLTGVDIADLLSKAAHRTEEVTPGK
ncbi:flotillin family protein [Jonesia denitrificans]|uniref:Band 7 protein n=1 Tax=Jonesia denitrificans (strain ATCC 14870 / DSM 20603 / BCRC 15368 / CIP 55.134 / JCM 11481 / NBRC 15587 / NCTC 10816 / Prevot 55134) TaxID=471856 RepID=C7R2I9_JONDD|nr:SPFH domain-containing protein [Jonesia denitrificans]ACV09980.1 band 7 protein [Jonesia denitrificans DSM 20603]ASE08782.1 flotillin family protein [Jonesia denitrificans]QXB43388.1 flotillin family protein [Jonesia denitrificans]SQH22754.1 Inner membrane protein yqiK [Jonesia denitrificans]